MRSKIAIASAITVVIVAIALLMLVAARSFTVSPQIAAITEDGCQILESDVNLRIAEYRSALGVTDEQDWKRWLADNDTTAEQVRADEIARIALHQKIMEFAYDAGMGEIDDHDRDEAIKRIAAQRGIGLGKGGENYTFRRALAARIDDPEYSGKALDDLIEEEVARGYLIEETDTLVDAGYGVSTNCDGAGDAQATRDEIVLDRARSYEDVVDGTLDITLYSSPAGRTSSH